MTEKTYDGYPINNIDPFASPAASIHSRAVSGVTTASRRESLFPRKGKVFKSQRVNVEELKARTPWYDTPVGKSTLRRTRWTCLGVSSLGIFAAAAMIGASSPSASFLHRLYSIWSLPAFSTMLTLSSSFLILPPSRNFPQLAQGEVLPRPRGQLRDLQHRHLVPRGRAWWLRKRRVRDDDGEQQQVRLCSSFRPYLVFALDIFQFTLLHPRFCVLCCRRVVNILTFSSPPSSSFVEDGKLYIVPTFTADTLGYDNVLNGYTLNLTADGTCTSTEESNCVVASNSTYGNITTLPPIMSARLTTKFSHSIKYGRVEVKAKMPTGDWIWPASASFRPPSSASPTLIPPLRTVWMLPTENTYGEWPRSGESAFDFLPSLLPHPLFLSSPLPSTPSPFACFRLVSLRRAASPLLPLRF
jgi:hypothetical protein